GPIWILPSIPGDARPRTGGRHGGEISGGTGEDAVGRTKVDLEERDGTVSVCDDHGRVALNVEPLKPGDRPPRTKWTRLFVQNEHPHRIRGLLKDVPSPASSN